MKPVLPRPRKPAPSAETRLWAGLRGRRLGGFKFRRQHRIDRYTVDFVTLSGRLVVEVDGATHATPSELAHDAERTRILESLGYLVIRVTNTEVHDNLDGTLSTILALLEGR